jgi:methylenetetrahydrofolate dehydrogenase (NADP+) / methenyltetrahydrofolate cyclohydrolase
VTPSAGQLRIPGSAVLREVLSAYQSFQPVLAAGTTVKVIRLAADDTATPAWSTRARASEISARRKIETFTSLGATPEEHVLSDRVSRAQFIEIIEQANADPRVAAIIVQLPLPSRLTEDLDRIAPAKDIDALGSRSDQPCCATAAGIARVVDPFLEPGTTVAVVGGRGFVGSDVTRLLSERLDRPIMVLDLDDDLRQVRNADVVVSTTGRAGLLTTEHLHQRHRLVVDSGFVPSGLEILGDVHPTAQHLPRAITPVPGGIGPIEMAVLAERLVQQHPETPTPVAWRSLIAPTGQRDQLTTAGQTVIAAQQAQAAAQAARALGQLPGARALGSPHPTGPTSELPPRGVGGPERRPGRHR